MSEKIMNMVQIPFCTYILYNASHILATFFHTNELKLILKDFSLHLSELSGLLGFLDCKSQREITKCLFETFEAQITGLTLWAKMYINLCTLTSYFATTFLHV